MRSQAAVTGCSEGGMPPPNSAARHARRLATASVVSLGVAGLLLAHRDVVFSGFRLVPGDLGDGRLVQYLLEHGYLWITRAAGHTAFWDPPFFFPAKNAGAYTDVLLAVAPPYWLARAGGAAPDTAFQLWVVACSALNYASGYLFFSRGLRTPALPSAIGAALFAFGSARAAQATHPQLLPQFWSALALLAVLRASNRETTRRRRPLWVWAAVLCGAAQVWSGFYHAFGLALALILALGVSLSTRRSRGAVVGLAREHALTLALAVVTGTLLVAPWISHALTANREVGARPYGDVLSMLPRPSSWIYLGPESVLHGWMSRSRLFQYGPGEPELRLGYGVVTTALAIVGLWFARREPLVRVVVLVSGVIIAMTTIVGGTTAWSLVYAHVPGGGAVRAVGRVALLLSLTVGAGVALTLAALARRRGGAPLAAVAAFVVLIEQGQRAPAYDKAIAGEDVAALASRVDARCRAFLFTPARGEDPPWKYHLDAMWASLARGVPTINGYAGSSPDEWYFEDTKFDRPESAWDILARLKHWADATGLDVGQVCWIRDPVPRRM